MTTRPAPPYVLVGQDWLSVGRGDVVGPPPVAAGSPYFGSTTTTSTGPGNASTPAAVITKYGAGASLRVFFSSGDLTLRATRPTGVSIMHVSYRPDPATVAGGSLDGQIVSLINSLHDGDILTFHHEPDNNGWSAAQIADWKAMTNHLYDIKQSTKPGLKVGPVYTGGLMASYTPDSTRDTWCKGLRSDLFGVDCDGVHISTSESNYNRISYLDEIQNCERYMSHSSNSGFQAITVPEHMTARVNPPDPTGSLRADWFSKQTQMMIDHGVYAVMVWDHNLAPHNTSTNFNELPAGSPELAVWKALVATNPATPRT